MKEKTKICAGPRGSYWKIEVKSRKDIVKLPTRHLQSLAHTWCLHLLLQPANLSQPAIQNCENSIGTVLTNPSNPIFFIMHIILKLKIFL